MICFCSTTGGLFMFYLQHQDWGPISQFVAGSTVSNLVVRNAICTSVCIWIMGKHVITSPRRLGIHPVLVFKLIPQMPSAWHFCEEAGTPSSYHCWNPPMGQNKPKAEFFSTSSYLLFPVPYLYQRTPPKVSFSLFTDRPEASDD